MIGPRGRRVTRVQRRHTLETTSGQRRAANGDDTTRQLKLYGGYCRSLPQHKVLSDVNNDNKNEQQQKMTDDRPRGVKIE